jgi:DNA-binding NarL/FixJ family response regulator
MSRSPDGKKGKKSNRLTARERETLAAVALGKSNKTIAQSLGISVRTVESHRASVIRKFDVSSTAEMVCYAIRKGILKP